MKCLPWLAVLAVACTPNGPGTDGGTASDSGPFADDGTMDGGHADAGHADAGRIDAGGHDAGHADAGGHDAGPRDAGESSGCVTDSDCGGNPCSSATCGTCGFCETSVHACSTMQLGTCPYDGGASDPNVMVYNASDPPNLQGQLIDVCCSFDGGTTRLATGYSLSPDGTRALAAADDSQFNEQLFLGPTGHPGTLVESTPAGSWELGFASFPVFSPDSTRLAGTFDTTTDTAGNLYASLWLAKADGSSGVFVDHYVDALYAGGACVLYDSTADTLSNQDGRTLHVASWTASSAGTVLDPYDDQPMPSFSPDGGAYVTWLAGDGSFKSLACATPTTVHTLAAGAAGSVWSPDAKQLLFVALSPLDGGLSQGTVTLSAWDGSNAQTFGNVDEQGDLAWSPDGKAITYETGSAGAHELHIREVVSGHEWVSPAETEIEQPQFTNDSTHVIYATGDPSTGQYAALYGVAVGAQPGSAPVRYGTSAPLAWDMTSAGGGWVAALFADPDPGAAALQKSTLVVWPLGGGASTTVTTYAGPQVVVFSLDGQYLAFGSWTQDGQAQLAAIARRTGTTWDTTHLMAISPPFNFIDGFTAAWATGDWLVVQSTTFGPAEALYVFKADATDLGQLASLAAPEWSVEPGGASAIYATSAGIWRVAF
jgi:hypothetical protein